MNAGTVIASTHSCVTLASGKFAAVIVKAAPVISTFVSPAVPIWNTGVTVASSLPVPDNVA